MLRHEEEEEEEEEGREGAALVKFVAGLEIVVYPQIFNARLTVSEKPGSPFIADQW